MQAPMEEVMKAQGVFQKVMNDFRNLTQLGEDNFLYEEGDAVMAQMEEAYNEPKDPLVDLARRCLPEGVQEVIKKPEDKTSTSRRQQVSLCRQEEHQGSCLCS